jgi:amino acid adenylation domain-containing protein
MTSPLHAPLDASVARHPDKVALVEPGRGTLTYRELGRISDRLRDRLLHLGVRQGERVGLYLHKSLDSICTLFGILKAGAAYVPVDPDAPAARCAYIFDDCSVRAIVCARALVPALREALAALGAAPPLIVLEEVTDGVRLDAALAALDAGEPAPRGDTVYPPLDSIAYMLYTSGSTGKPKGVTISHRAALAFVDWCSDTFGPREDDVFSSHAPLHFDLSIHDIYVSLKHGATLVLIGEELGKEPQKLAQLVADARVSIWYSTPSILALLAQHGRLDRHDCSRLRIVHFAGEVFPIPQFRALHALWPHPRYFNLYGPTETNVCTWYEVKALEPDRTEPFPIGVLCAHYRGRVVDQVGRDVAFGEEGELVIAGPGVMSGYWNLPERNAAAFLQDEAGQRWYRTGDLVVETREQGYLFHGRRDRMVKRRGYRVELGEIEAGLATHPLVREVAVVAGPAGEAGVRIRAFLSCRDGARPSIIQLKQFCMDVLPKYMVPDAFTFLDALPRTSTDKIDYQSLQARA